MRQRTVCTSIPLIRTRNDFGGGGSGEAEIGEISRNMALIGLKTKKHSRYVNIYVLERTAKHQMGRLAR